MSPKKKDDFCEPPKGKRARRDKDDWLIPEPLEVILVPGDPPFENGYKSEVTISNPQNLALPVAPWLYVYESPLFDLNPLKKLLTQKTDARNINYSDSFIIGVTVKNFGAVLAGNGDIVYNNAWWAQAKAFDGVIINPTLHLNMMLTQAVLGSCNQDTHIYIPNIGTIQPESAVLEYLIKKPNRFFKFWHYMRTKTNTINPEIEFTLELGRYRL